LAHPLSDVGLRSRGTLLQGSVRGKHQVLLFTGGRRQYGAYRHDQVYRIHIRHPKASSLSKWHKSYVTSRTRFHRTVLRTRAMPHGAPNLEIDSEHQPRLVPFEINQIEGCVRSG